MSTILLILFMMCCLGALIAFEGSRNDKILERNIGMSLELISSILMILLAIFSVPVIDAPETISLSSKNNYQIKRFTEKGKLEEIDYKRPLYDTKYNFSDDKDAQATIYYKTSILNHLLNNKPEHIDKIIVTLPKDMQDKILNE